MLPASIWNTAVVLLRLQNKAASALAELMKLKHMRNAPLNCVVAATVTKVSVPARCSGLETQLCMKNGSVKERLGKGTFVAT